MSGSARQLREMFAREWEWRLAEFPATLQRDPTSPVADRLARVDPAAQEARLAHWHTVLDELASIDPARLEHRDRLEHAAFRFQIESLVASATFADHEMPLTSDTAFWLDCVATGRRAMRTDEDRRRWIAQMRDLPRHFDDQIGQMRRGLARGFTPARVSLQGHGSAIERSATVDPDGTAFFLPFRALDGGALRDEARAVITDAVQPAYRRLLRFFREEYLPGARTSIAAADLPDGEAYYRAKVREHTTLDLDPAEIHELGLEEVADIRRRMQEPARAAGFDGDVPAFVAHLRSDPRHRATSGEELLMRAAWTAKKFDAVAGDFFGRLPRARMAIRPVPDDIAPFYTVGRAIPGAYLLNLHRPEDRALYNLPALTLHEGEPGHVWQIALALEQEDIPAFRRYAYLPAYGEGWALYAEELGLEMGIYASPYEHFGMLGYQMWRAARLVVDTGIHAFGWSRQRAIDYLGAATALPHAEVVSEIDRYISWPGQALSYYLGKVAITRARARAERTAGAAFDLRDFHDAVLALGPVPLHVLDAALDGANP
jgi:uncharacterized protein (DUF885 family)